MRVLVVGGLRLLLVRRLRVGISVSRVRVLLLLSIGTRRIRRGELLVEERKLVDVVLL